MNTLERLMARTVMDPNSGCWLWFGAHVPKGYGRLKGEGTRKTVYAHRLSYELHVGHIPDGLRVCHSCDTPACVNPAHLWLGTDADNANDMKEKQRQSRGEARYNAKLTEAQARFILASPAKGQVLADMFGVSRSCIRQVRKGLRWQSLHDKRSLSQLATEELAA